MPRPRFTLRWLMVVVGTVAVGLATGVRVMTGRMSRAYQYNAELAAIAEQAAADTAAYWEKRYPRALAWDLDSRKPRVISPFNNPTPPVGGWAAECLREMKRFRAREAHHAGRRLKYERAARYPRLPVAPDPPEPE